MMGHAFACGPTDELLRIYARQKQKSKFLPEV